MPHLDTTELYQVYLTGLETGRSVPLDRLAEPGRWIQPPLITKRHYPPDPETVLVLAQAAEIVRQAQLDTWAPIYRQVASFVAQESVRWSEISRAAGAHSIVDSNLSKAVTDSAGVATLAVVRSIFPGD